MKVNNENERMKQPNRCDCCGVVTGELVSVHNHRGLQHFVDWLCPYCRVVSSMGESQHNEAMALMFNELESRIMDKLK
jgi:hypothetical protein